MKILSGAQFHNIYKVSPNSKIHKIKCFLREFGGFLHRCQKSSLCWLFFTVLVKCDMFIVNKIVVFFHKLSVNGEIKSIAYCM